MEKGGREITSNKTSLPLFRSFSLAPSLSLAPPAISLSPSLTFALSLFLSPFFCPSSLSMCLPSSGLPLLKQIHLLATRAFFCRVIYILPLNRSHANGLRYWRWSHYSTNKSFNYLQYRLVIFTDLLGYRTRLGHISLTIYFLLFYYGYYCTEGHCDHAVACPAQCPFGGERHVSRAGGCEQCEAHS